MVTELDPGVHSIDIPLPGNPLRNLNSFLIRGSERNLLVDTGFNMEPSLAAMREGLSQLAVDMESTDIFLTHLHSDHIGLAPVIASGKSRIFISGPDREFMRMHMEAGGREELDRYFLSFGFPPKELEENRSKNPAVIYLSKREVEYTEVSDGQVLDLGGRRLECVHTPGHSPGHMCLLDRDNGLLFCGDHIIFTISPNITSWPSVPDSLGNYLASLEMTGTLPVRRAFSAHRQVEGDLARRIDELRLHHAHRLDEAAEAVSFFGEAAVCQVASRMTWSIRAKDWNDFPVSQKWFAVGETHAHLEYLRLRGRIRGGLENGMFRYRPA